ncbi:UbiD family decarboxylase [Mycolicibacterium hodleri]|uniref:UbiD family decarboxylase n=1 Tax=Mycolicibacterium hodleri TaxID=49897 RepID=UPI0013762DC4|nr:UbiD family decarboxylase [Mycolicibacterium hodleri]
MTHFADLRSYLDYLESIREVQRITHPVALDLEIGAISRRAGETGAPAPLFENILERHGTRVLGAPGGVSAQPGQWLARVATAIGLAPTATGRDIVDAFANARAHPGIPPTVVSTGPCKQNIHLGAEVDLMSLPAPLLHDGDGGRYLNTFGIICCHTPDKSWTSWSIARIMVVDEHRMAGIVAPNQHVGMVRQTWTDIGQDMPFALALGGPPVLPYVGGMPLPDYHSEVDFAGALTGRPIEVTAAETVDVLVPATAEIVVEGHLSRTDTAPEGPMGEYAGYLWDGPPSPKPVYRVSAITHRDDPILPISVAGEPPEENHTAWGIPNAGEIVYQLRTAGFPVATAWSPFESANHWFVIAVERDWRTSTGLTGEQLCRRMAEILFTTKAGMGTPKYLVVNDDIDITNTREVLWAFATRNHPGSEGALIYDDENTNPLVAYLDDADKKMLRTTKVIYNCLDPEHLRGHLPKRSSFRHIYPQELQDHVLANWHAYGYDTSTGATGSPPPEDLDERCLTLRDPGSALDTTTMTISDMRTGIKSTTRGTTT